MNIEYFGFDWDEGNRAKCEKHGISYIEIEKFFEGRISIQEDEKHSGSERRLFAIGRGPGGRPMFVGFTLRELFGQIFIRPVTARFMHAKEIQKYEKTNPNI